METANEAALSSQQASEGLECEGAEVGCEGGEDKHLHEKTAMLEGPGMFVGTGGADRWDEWSAQSVLVWCDRRRPINSARRPRGRAIPVPRSRPGTALRSRRAVSSWQVALFIRGHRAAVRVSNPRLTVSKGPLVARSRRPSRFQYCIFGRQSTTACTGHHIVLRHLATSCLLARLFKVP